MARRKLREGQSLHKVLGVPALFSTAYGNVGSSIYYALGSWRRSAGADACRLHPDGIAFRHHCLALRRGNGVLPEPAVVELHASGVQ